MDMKKKKDIRQIEYYLNGKLFKVCPYNQWNKVSYQIKDILYKNKYMYSYSNEYINRLPNTWDVYVLPEKYKVIVVSHKIFTGHYDRKGNKIYDGDKVKTPHGFDSCVNGHYDSPDHYYVRTYGLRSSWSDYDIDDWSQYEKVEDVNKTPKKFWNEPEMTDKSILK